MNNAVTIIPALEPVDALAKIVTSAGPKIDFKGPKQQQNPCDVDVLPPLSPVPRGMENLTGRRFGRFVVCGIVFPKGKTTCEDAAIRKAEDHRGPLWLVKCQCGRYELRRRRAIKRAIQTGDNVACCRWCFHWKSLSRRRHDGCLPLHASERKAPEE